MLPKNSVIQDCDSSYFLKTSPDDAKTIVRKNYLLWIEFELIFIIKYTVNIFRHQVIHILNIKRFMKIQIKE